MFRCALTTSTLALALFLPALVRADAQPKGDMDLDGDWELQSSVEDGAKETRFSPIVHKLSFREESLVFRTIVDRDVLIEFKRKLFTRL
jgi:hypothetical protein